MPGSGEGEGREAPREPWGVALGKAVLILGAAYLGFAYLAGAFTTFLASRVPPAVRDLLVTAWVVGWFVALSFALVALQRRRGAR